MADSKKKRILIVDDDIVLRETIQQCVEREGFEAILATDGRWALELISKEPVDLIISDISMPDIDGLELLEAVRKVRDLPVIVMSAFAMDSEVKRAKDLGVSAFMNKPFRCGQLVIEIRKVFQK